MNSLQMVPSGRKGKRRKRLRRKAKASDAGAPGARPMPTAKKGRHQVGIRRESVRGKGDDGQKTTNDLLYPTTNPKTREN